MGILAIRRFKNQKRFNLTVLGPHGVQTIWTSWAEMDGLIKDLQQMRDGDLIQVDVLDCGCKKRKYENSQKNDNGCEG